MCLVIGLIGQLQIIVSDTIQVMQLHNALCIAMAVVCWSFLNFEQLVASYYTASNMRSIFILTLIYFVVKIDLSFRVQIFWGLKKRLPVAKICVMYMYMCPRCYFLQVGCSSVLQPSAKILYILDELLFIRSFFSVHRCSKHNEGKFQKVFIILCRLCITSGRIYLSIFPLVLVWVQFNN